MQARGCAAVRMLQRVVQRQDATGCSAQAVPVQGLALGFEQCPGGALDSITRRRAVAVQTARRGWALVALACGVQDAKNKNDPACRLDSDHTCCPHFIVGVPRQSSRRRKGQHQRQPLDQNKLQTRKPSP